MEASAVQRNQRLFELYLPILMMAIVSRLLLTYANWFTIKVLDFVPRLGHVIQGPLFPNQLWLDGWVRWDSWHYLIIAGRGYDATDTGLTLGGAAFFPAYPMLMRLFATVTGHTGDGQVAAFAGMLISNTCFIAALVLLADMVRDMFSLEIARTTAFIVCVFPTSFFFNAVYTESLFLLAVVLSFWFARRESWLLAALAVVLAGATRLLGLALIPALLWMAYRRGASIADYAKIVLVSPWGTLGYFIYLWIEYGDPLTYFHAQSNSGGWQIAVGNYLDIIGSTPYEMVSEPLYNIIVAYVVIALAFVAVLPVVWKILDRGVALFTTIIVVFHLFYTWNSLGRYMLGALGCFVAFAWLLHHPRCPRWVEPVTLSLSTILLALFSVLFANGFWVI